MLTGYLSADFFKVEEIPYIILKIYNNSYMICKLRNYERSRNNIVQNNLVLLLNIFRVHLN